MILRRHKVGTTVPCRDAAGRRAHLTVQLADDRVLLMGPDGEAVSLAPLAAGRLRAALRDALRAESAGT